MTGLNEDVWRMVFEAAGCSANDYSRAFRDQESINTLLACCRVCKTWRRLAQPLLERMLVINTEKQLNRRLLGRPHDDLRTVREVVMRESGHDHFNWDPEVVLRALPTDELGSLSFCDGANVRERDAFDRTLIGTGHHAPAPYPFTLSNLRDAVLCNFNGGASWTPLLQVTPKLKHLSMRGVGWSGNSCYAGTPLYLPKQPPPFALQSLEIHRSHIRSRPLRWLLSESTQSLEHLGVRFQQREWATMAEISTLRTDGLLPNVKHLSVETSEENVKNWGAFLSDPLGKWSGIQSIYMYGSEPKCRAAIIHGIAQLDPIPVVELGVGDMRMHEFKALFKLRKGKFRRSTVLRLITRPPCTSHAHRGYGPWDWQAPAYWEDMEEEAVEFAERYGVTLEISSVSKYA